MSEQFKTSHEKNENFENPKEIIASKLDNIGEKSAENLEKKIKLSYQGLQELTLFVSKQEKISLKETLAEINISENDKKELASLSEQSFQSMKESFIPLEIKKNQQIDSIINSEIIDPLTRKIFSSARCENAQNNINGNISHHIDGAIVGFAQSTIILGKVTIDVIIDIVKLPYHLVLLISGKCKLPDYQA